MEHDVFFHNTISAKIGESQRIRCFVGLFVDGNQAQQRRGVAYGGFHGGALGGSALRIRDQTRFRRAEGLTTRGTTSFRKVLHSQSVKCEFPL